jgi:hypothetical protein
MEYKCTTPTEGVARRDHAVQSRNEMQYYNHPYERALVEAIAGFGRLW